MIGFGFLALFSLFGIALINNSKAKKERPSDSTYENGIEAKSLEYKGHKYILFERTNLVGPISIIHDPDCCK